VLHQLVPHARLGLLREKLHQQELLSLHKLPYITVLGLNYQNVTAEIVKKLQAINKEVWVYTINGITSTHRMLQYNVDALITDYPALTRELVNNSQLMYQAGIDHELV